MHLELRRLLASLDFRFAHVTAGSPEGFGEFKVQDDVRPPREIVEHLCNLLAMIDRPPPEAEVPAGKGKTFEAECGRFRAALRRLDSRLAQGLPLDSSRTELDLDRLIKGPVSDALTHIGQLAMLRRLAGSPVARVSYTRAEMPAPASGWVSEDL